MVPPRASRLTVVASELTLMPYCRGATGECGLGPVATLARRGGSGPDRLRRAGPARSRSSALHARPSGARPRPPHPASAPGPGDERRLKPGRKLRADPSHHARRRGSLASEASLGDGLAALDGRHGRPPARREVGHRSPAPESRGMGFSERSRAEPGGVLRPDDLSARELDVVGPASTYSMWVWRDAGGGSAMRAARRRCSRSRSAVSTSRRTG